jgi:hypothetical protein
MRLGSFSNTVTAHCLENLRILLAKSMQPLPVKQNVMFA